MFLFNKLVVTKIVVVGLLLALVTMAFAQSTVQFSNISEGSKITGLTTLKGTVMFPEFSKFEIFLKSGDKMVWTGNSHMPIVDGNLVRIDPRVIQSGSYQVVVRKVNPDSNYEDEVGPTITIENPNGSPLPYYPEVEPSFLYSPEGKALLRVRNCAGDELFFDYGTPENSGDSGDLILEGKSGDSICRFVDIALRPSQYHGTARGGTQDASSPIGFTASAGDIFEMIYWGADLPIKAQPIGGDSPQAATTTSQPTTGSTASNTLPRTGEVVNEAPAPAPAAEMAPTTNVILPETGQGTGNMSAFVVVAGGFIVALVVGGFLAMRRRKINV